MSKIKSDQVYPSICDSCGNSPHTLYTSDMGSFCKNCCDTNNYDYCITFNPYYEY